MMVACLEKRGVTLDRLRTLMSMCGKHYKQYWYAYALLAIATIWFMKHYTFASNRTESLPQNVFLIVKGENVYRGQYGAFAYQGNRYYPDGITFIKQLRGMPGDRIDHVNNHMVLTTSRHQFDENGVPLPARQAVEDMGVLFHEDKLGNELTITPAQEIKTGWRYMYAPHPKSLDSRYTLIGLVHESEMIGRAYPLF